MDKTIRRWVHIGFLGVALVGAMVWRALGTAPGVAAKMGSPAAASKAPNVQLSPLMAYATPLSDSANRGGVVLLADDIRWGMSLVRRDPFYLGTRASRALEREHAAATSSRVAHAARGATVAEWHVSATLLAGDKRAAVINDELVYVGDRLPGGATLTQVERDRVLVTDGKGAPHVVAVKEGDT